MNQLKIHPGIIAVFIICPASLSINSLPTDRLCAIDFNNQAVTSPSNFKSHGGLANMPISRLSIRHQLFLIVFTIAFPAICIIINSGLQQRKDSISKAKIETQKLAEAIVNEQKNLTSSARQLFIALSQLPEVTARNQPRTQKILTEILKLSPQYSNIFIAETSGSVWVSAIPLNESVSVSDRRYFRNAISSGRLSSGEYHIARTSRKATLNLGYPLKDSNGKVTGVICIGLSLDRYKNILDSYKLPQGASFAILDHKGVILARAIEPEKFVGKPSDPKIFKQMSEGPEEETSIGTSSVTGDNRIQTYRKIRLEGEESPYIYVRVGIPTAAAISAANAALASNLSIYTLFLATAFLLSWFIGKKYIIDRVLVLEQSSHSLADGNLSIRIADKVTGGELGNLGKSFDIMAEKLTMREEALAASERFLHTIIDTEPECVSLIDTETKVVMINRAGLEMIQADSFEQVKGIKAFSFVAPEYHDAFLKLTSDVLLGGTGILQFEIEGFKGRRLWMEAQMVPFRDGKDLAVSALCIARDITEQRKAAQENALLMQQLSQSQKYESIGRLAGGVAHDFNNLLTPIIGYAGLMENEFAKDSTTARRLQNILLASEKARNLVKQLLSFSRKQVLEISALDINPLIVSFQDILRRTIRENIEIRYNLTNETVIILADGNHIEQVIMNLVVNAQDAISGNGAITIETAPAVLDDAYASMHIGAKAGRYLTLTVSDNGCGMDRETQQHIFEPFFTTKGVGHGTGLGLSTVYGIVKQHGGSIWVYSEAGMGSTFKLYFPAVDEHPAEEKAAAVKSHMTQTTGSILLVEDDQMVRDMTLELLKDAGFDVVAANSPAMALQKCHEATFDLLLSDVIMPEMTGPELYSRILQTKPELKVLFMSGYSNSIVSHQGILDEGICFIQKPFTIDELLEKIRNVLNP